MKIRKNLKSGNAIVIALLVTLVIGLIVALTITIVTLVKINNSNSDKNSNNDVNNGIIDNTNKEDEKNNNDEEKFDPYANYKDLTWNTSTKIDSTVGLKYEIKNGKLYYSEGSSAQKLVAGITGTPIKLNVAVVGGGFAMYIVTSNKIYITGDGYDGKAQLIADLGNHDIIDMTVVNSHGQEYNYYLTSTGSLIDRNGVVYDKNRFVDSCILNLYSKISIDKNLYGYYYDGKTYSAVQDKSSGEKIVMSKIYYANGNDLALILSKTNKLYEYDGKSNKATYIGELDKIKQASNDNNDYLTINVYLKNGNSKSYEYVDKKAYDVVNKKDIDLTKLEKIETNIDNVELKQVRTIAELAWSEAYINGVKEVNDLKVKVIDALEDNNIDLTKYNVTVTEKGVTVSVKN